MTNDPPLDQPAIREVPDIIVTSIRSWDWWASCVRCVAVVLVSLSITCSVIVAALATTIEVHIVQVIAAAGAIITTFSAKFDLFRKSTEVRGNYFRLKTAAARYMAGLISLNDLFQVYESLTPAVSSFVPEGNLGPQRTAGEHSGKSR